MNPNPSSPEKITPDDPRLTAFALGELTGAEHATLAAAVAADPALAAEVESVRALAAEMHATLAAEPAVSPSNLSNQPAPAAAPLNEANRAGAASAAKADAAVAREPKGKLLRFPSYYWLATAAAACFALVVWVKNPSAPAARETVAAQAASPQTAPAETQLASRNSIPVPQQARVKAVPQQAVLPAPPASNGIDQPRYQPGVVVAADGTAATPAATGPAPALPEAPATAQGARAGRGASGAAVADRLDMAAASPSSRIEPPAGGVGSAREMTKAGTGTVTLDGQRTFTGGGANPASQPAPGGAPLVLNGAGDQFGGGFTPGAGAPGGGPGGGAAARGTGGLSIAGGGVARGGAGRGGRGAPGPGAAAPQGRAGGAGYIGGLGGRGPAAPVTVVATSPVVVNIGYDPDAGYRYPLPAPDVIIRRPQPPPPAPREPSAGEQYARLRDNPFTDPAREPFSTFSADVDTASYANLRRFLQGQNRLPPPDAVRIEEMVNYFPYGPAASSAPAAGSARPASAAPFTTAIESAPAPWLPSHRLVRVTLKARDVAPAQRGPANLVFLLDVSGSMDAANKLPLVKESMRLLLSRLRPDDRVAIVTYANGSGVALPSTPVERRTVILDAIDSLRAEGGTNGAAGIQLAYQVAQENLNREGVNRVILCTDGDFNVGATGAALTQMVVERARGGVFLSVLGFGMNNLNDAQLEQLADRGNGHYGYIDTRAEAQKMFVDQLSGTLVTVAKDVKFQVEFNPARVAAYRLIGYEDRLLAAQDFNNDRVDAGEVGAGHTVTALYEIVPPGADYGYPTTPGTDAPRYTETTAPTRPADAPRPTAGANSPELLTVKVRYKQPASDVSEKLEFPFTDGGARFEQASADLRFAAAVAGFGMVLRESPYRGGTTLTDVLAWADGALGQDPGGLRAEFTELVRRARDLRGERGPQPYGAPGTDARRY